MVKRKRPPFWDRFAAARRAEIAYRRRLNELSKQIQSLVLGIFHPHDPATIAPLVNALNDYADRVKPWAEGVATRMLTDVASRDLKAWAEHGKEIGVAMRGMASSAPIGNEFKELQDLQVDLITSIPRERAQQVHELSLSHLLEGRRWEEVAQSIQKDVPAAAQWKAALIARTETSRAAGQFTMVRAMHMGSEGYVWRTSHDADVRPEHRELEGTYHRWDDPPVAGQGRGHSEMRYHPGGGPNCRCVAEVVMPDEPQVDRSAIQRNPEYLASLRPEAESLNDAYRAGKMSHAVYASKLRDLAHELGI